MTNAGPQENVASLPGANRPVPVVAWLVMLLAAVSLAAVSTLHLVGDLGKNGKPPFSATGAGVAEAVIASVLIFGLLAVVARRPWAWLAALSATVFAVVGFCVGLVFTLSGGDGFDVAYHLTVLPFLLIATYVLYRSRN